MAVKTEEEPRNVPCDPQKVFGQDRYASDGTAGFRINGISLMTSGNEIWLLQMKWNVKTLLQERGLVSYETLFSKG